MFHFELIVGIPVPAIVADAVVLPVEPVSFILRLLVVLPVMVVIEPPCVVCPLFVLCPKASPWLVLPCRRVSDLGSILVGGQDRTLRGMAPVERAIDGWS